MAKKAKQPKKKSKPFLCYWLVEYTLGSAKHQLISRDKPKLVSSIHGIAFTDVWDREFVILGNVVMSCLKPASLPFLLDNLFVPDDVQAEFDDAMAEFDDSDDE